MLEMTIINVIFLTNVEKWGDSGPILLLSLFRKWIKKVSHFYEPSLNSIKTHIKARFFLDLDMKWEQEHVKSVLNILCVT